MTEREARELAALRIMIFGLPGSPNGVGPLTRLVDKRRRIIERWEERKAKRAARANEPGEPPAA